MFSSEVLPAPFGPMIDISSPRRTDSDRLSTARTPPKCFDTSAMASCVAPAAALAPFKLSDTRPPAFPHPPALSAHAVPLWQAYCRRMQENAITQRASARPLTLLSQGFDTKTCHRDPHETVAARFTLVLLG